MSDPTVQDASYNLRTGGIPYSPELDEGEQAAISIAREKDCNTAIRTLELHTPNLPFTMAGSASPVKVPEAQSSGGDNDYWVASITHPKRLEPCQVECEDLIELFEMSFQEGEAFKALWRNGQMRIGNGKPGDSHLRNAEKVAHFGSRMVAKEARKCAHLTAA